MRLICESQVVGQLTRLGARPLTDPKLVSLMAGREPTPEQNLPAAREVGARVVFSMAVKPDIWRPSPMSAVGIGIGGWGGSGGYYGGSGGAVGVTVPVGGAQGAVGLAATGMLVDVASGRVIWTATATPPPGRRRHHPDRRTDARTHRLDAPGGTIFRCDVSIGCSPELREDEGSRILSTSLGGPDEQS